MVEALGQEEEWTERQVRLLSDLASDLEARPDFGQEEQEVAAAIRRGMHRIGLRQGVFACVRSARPHAPEKGMGPHLFDAQRRISRH